MSRELGSEGLLHWWPYQGEQIPASAMQNHASPGLPPVVICPTSGGNLTSHPWASDIKGPNRPSCHRVCLFAKPSLPSKVYRKNEESGQPWAAGTRQGLLDATG